MLRSLGTRLDNSDIMTTTRLSWLLLTITQIFLESKHYLITDKLYWGWYWWMKSEDVWLKCSLSKLTK